MAFGQCRYCSQIEWASQEVSSSLGFKGLGLLLHPWALVAPSQGICLQVVKCWFTHWDQPWYAVRFALSQYWFVSFNRVLVTGWYGRWRMGASGRFLPTCFCLSMYSMHLSAIAKKIIHTFPSPFVFFPPLYIQCALLSLFLVFFILVSFCSYLLNFLSLKLLLIVLMFLLLFGAWLVCLSCPVPRGPASRVRSASVCRLICRRVVTGPLTWTSSSLTSLSTFWCCWWPLLLDRLQ